MRYASREMLGTALLALCVGIGFAASAQGESVARVYGARAHHRHGDCELPANSPGGHGLRITPRGDRVYEASAHHPFSVGHYAHYHELYGAGAWPLWITAAPGVELGTVLSAPGHCDR